MHYLHEIALRYHRRMPTRIREYLNQRGIADFVIHAYLLGWNGSRITIPIRNISGRIASFRLARDPADSESPKMLTTPGARAELYGWEVLMRRPDRIIVCEGEFDRLVLASYGFAAVTSTGGAATFRDEWVSRIAQVSEVYLCFDRDDAGRHGAAMIAARIDYARVVTLPDDVGDGGDIGDFFVRLGRTAAEFEVLLRSAKPLHQVVNAVRPRRARMEPHVTRLVPIEKVIGEVIHLRKVGSSYAGLCPFHNDNHPSFVVFPETFTFYCFGCGKHGDVIDFLRFRFDLSFVAAAALLRKFKRNGRAA